jgi:hypothetical protein
MSINIEIVDDIPREKSGKYKWIVSKLASKGYSVVKKYFKYRLASNISTIFN